MQTAPPRASILYILCFILLYLYVNAFRSTIIDDAFIQFNYADTLARDGSWGFYADQTTNTATSPLNVLFLSLFALLTGSAVSGAIWLNAILLLLLLVVLQHLSRKLFNNSFFGLFLFLSIACNPLLLSCLGMETILFAVLSMVCLTLFVFQRWHWLAACLALLVLARPDGFLLFLILAAGVLRTSKSAKSKLLFIAIYILLLLPWHLYAWIYLGSLVPDTLLIKTNQQSWLGGISFGSGLGHLYFFRFPYEMLFSFLLLPFGFFAAGSSNRNAVFLLIIASAYAAIHYGAYSALKVPPYHWYYSHLVLGLLIAGSIGAASISAGLGRWRYLLLILPLSGFLYMIGTEGFPLREAPVHTNWATHDQYREIGEWLRQNTEPEDTFIMGGEIGTLAYYSDRLLLNRFSDPRLLQRALNQKINKDSKISTKLWRINFLWRKESKRYPRKAYIIEHILSPHPPRSGSQIVKFWRTGSKWIPEGTLYLRKMRQS